LSKLLAKIEENANEYIPNTKAISKGLLGTINRKPYGYIRVWDSIKGMYVVKVKNYILEIK